MKFTEKFPELVDATKRFPEKMLGPHPEVICGPGLAQTWRMYPCASCHVVTGFRLELGDNFPMVPCCSEECSAVLKADRKEITGSEYVPAVAVEASCPCVTPEPLVPLDKPAEPVAEPAQVLTEADVAESFDEMFLTTKPVNQPKIDKISAEIDVLEEKLQQVLDTERRS